MNAIPPSPIGTVVESPCIRICEMDQTTGLCRGCKRTLEEIGGWRKMTDDERRAVMADLDNR